MDSKNLRLITILGFILIPLSLQAAKPPNFAKRADANAQEAQAAFQRVFQVLNNWESVIDKKTGLIPKGLNKPELNQWIPKDTAADNYAHLLIASLILKPDHADQWTSMIEKERSICGPMPCIIDLEKGTRIDEPQDLVVFGAAEYAKDGLLSVVERMGEGPWLNRMIEITNVIIDQASIHTKFGLIPSQNAEVNGDMLQILSRLWWRTNNARYLTMAERIADVYLQEVLPKNFGAIPYIWNFEANKPIDNRNILRDHGNELFVGLSEFAFLEKMARRPKASRYQKLISDLYIRTESIGRDKSGIWLEYFDPQTGTALKGSINDNWGYLCNGYQTLSLLDSSPFYSQTVVRSIQSVLDAKWINWGWGDYDGLSDTLESMILLVPWQPSIYVKPWLKNTLDKLYKEQIETGWLDQNYLEGNFVRTVLLYASFKTQGLSLSPWRPDLAWGAEWDPHKSELNISVSSAHSWKGQMKFDAPRHQSIWKMPGNYPRLNSAPEWFVANPEKTYTLQTRKGPIVYSGTELIQGIPLVSEGSKKVTHYFLKLQ